MTTVDGWEAGLFLLALTGLALAAWNLQDAIWDWRALKAALTNGDKAIISVSHVRRGITRVLVMAGFVAFAALQALRPNPEHSDWLRIGSILLLYFLVALPMQGAWWDLQARRKLLK